MSSFARAMIGLGCAFLLFAPGVPAIETQPPPGRDRAYYLFSLGQQARLNRDYVDALRFLEEAVQQDDSSELNLELADFYLALNQPVPAERKARRAIAGDASSVEARTTLARALLSQAPDGTAGEGRRKEAEQVYRDLLEEKVADPDVYLSLSAMQIEREDLAGAVAILEPYRAAHRPSVEVELQLARLYRQMDRLADAIAVLQPLAARERGLLEAQEELGTTLQLAGRTPEAAEVFRRMVDLVPQNLQLRHRLGQILIDLDRFPEAQEQLSAGLAMDAQNVPILLALGRAYEGGRQGAAAEEAYRKALEKDPSSLESRYLLGHLLEARGSDEEALELFRQIQERSRGADSETGRAFHAAAGFQMGVIAFLKKDFGGAAKAIEEVLATTESPSADQLALLVRALVQGDRLKEAGERVATARRSFPEDLRLAALEGEVSLRRGDPTTAQKQFRELIARGGASEEAYVEVLEACLRAERAAEASPWMAEALLAHPGAKDLRFRQAALEERLGRFREAEERFRELLREDAENGEALNYLGYMLADRGEKLEEALQMTQKAVNLDPDNAAYLDSLGWAHFRLGRLDQALNYLTQSARRSRSDPTIHDHLGDALARQGRMKEALAAYQIALEHRPENPEAIRKKIRRIKSSPSTP